MSDLVGNPEERFSRVTAQMILQDSTQYLLLYPMRNCDSNVNEHDKSLPR